MAQALSRAGRRADHTLGSDAHTPEYISCAMEERQELLKDCGLRYFATYDRKKPIFHKI